MKRILLVLLFYSIYLQVFAQKDNPVGQDILVIDLGIDVVPPREKVIKKINIPRGFLKMTKRKLIANCKDSASSLHGNCFKVTYFDSNEFHEQKESEQYYLTGVIYSLSSDEHRKIANEIDEQTEAQKTSKREKYNYIDTTRIGYNMNLTFQYGGESKITLLPKFSVLRIHNHHKIKPYYGLEFGIHPLLTGAAFTFTGATGVEINRFNLETSISYFLTTKFNDGDGGFNGPYSQNLINLKLGYRIRKFTVKVGTSFLVNENIPAGDEGIPLLDIGQINGQIFGIELQYRIN